MSENRSGPDRPLARTGEVFLVGAGPGDPGLITVKGLDRLRQGEVVVYDRLVDKRLLAETSPEAELIYVGKAPTAHVTPQQEINALLVNRARQGKRVVRLKGGDPFVFGRGGEEAEALVAAGVRYEVVPGVSAAIAVPAYAGIPVTHRERAASVAIVTGQEDPRKVTSGIDWPALARMPTVVFLMGVKNLPEIAATLVENGRTADTPVAIISWGTFAKQSTITGTLGNIATQAIAAGVKPPAVIVVGETVGLRDHLRWFDNRPLFGKRVLVTRAREQAADLSKLLEEQGATAIELPAIAIRPLNDCQQLDAAIERLESYDWAIFTSVNGVKFFFERVMATGRDVRALKGVRLCAIGPATATALAARSLRVDYVPDAYVAEAVAAGLMLHGVAGKRFLLPRAREAREVVVTELERAGAAIDEVPVYETIPAADTATAAKALFDQSEIDVVTFTSSSTARNLVGLLDGKVEALNATAIACIGPITADTARRLGLRVDIVAGEHTMSGLVRAIVAYEKERAL